ncbi:MAG: hypothetical protein FWH22_02790, partial [Fibromonadales bacterium]|nr:hypothetical protein [Fibromonadales bacterium]
MQKGYFMRKCFLGGFLAVSTFLIFLVSCGKLSEQADWRNKEITTSFRAKGIDGYSFEGAQGENADFQNPSGTSPVFRKAELSNAR